MSFSVHNLWHWIGLLCVPLGVFFVWWLVGEWHSLNRRWKIGYVMSLAGALIDLSGLLADSTALWRNLSRLGSVPLAIGLWMVRDRADSSRTKCKTRDRGKS